MEMEGRKGEGDGGADGVWVGEEAEGGRGNDRGAGSGRRREHLKSLRRFEVFAVKIIEDTHTSEERTRLAHAVAELCAVLAENRYLSSISVEVQVANQESGSSSSASSSSEEDESGDQERLLEPFRTLEGVRDVQFSGAVKNWAFVAGLRDQMMQVDGEEEGEEEMDLAAWEDVEGSAM